MPVEILGIRREALFKDGEFQGFVSFVDKNFLPLLLKNSEYRLRNESLEKDATFKQIIPYIVVVNLKTKRVFGYKRSKAAPGLHETRLHDKFSIGLGGHIDKLEFKKDIIAESMMREFREEVKMKNYPVPKILGFLNSELTEVDRMHFAIVAIAETNEEVEKRENDEVTEERFYSLEEVKRIMEDKSISMDTWTRVVWPAVKDYVARR